MLRIHRNLVFAVLMLVLIAGPLPAQRAEGIINRELEQISRALVDSFNQLERRRTRNRLAVVEFENVSELAREQNLGAVFAEILTDYLAENTGVFDVYERAQLDSVLREQELAVSDLADPDEAIKIGELTGAHLLVLGSVLQVGNDVQVVARLVETESGQILGSHTAMIPKDVFVEITQVLVELRNSVLLDYRFLFLQEAAVSTVSVAYRYAFSRGLSFAIQAHFGGNHGVIPTTTTLVSDPFDWESSFTETGMAFLFGLGSSRPGAVRWEVQLGPALTAYHDETLLLRFREGGSWYAGGEEFDKWYILFGGSAGAFIDFTISQRFGIYLGGQFHLFTQQLIEQDVWYEDAAAVQQLVIFRRDISLSGAVVKAGIRYTF